MLCRIAAAVFALAGIAFAVNASRHEAADFERSMAVLQFSLGVVFLGLGVSYSKRAEAEEAAAKDEARVK